MDRELLQKGKIYCNYSAGLRIYCADREKVIREFENPIAVGDFKWIFNVIVKLLNSYNLFFTKSDYPLPKNRRKYYNENSGNALRLGTGHEVGK